MNQHTAFQKYLLAKFGASDIDSLDVDHKVELSAALDKLLTEHGYEYKFDEEGFKFTFDASYPGAEFLVFKVNFIVSPIEIYVSVSPDVYSSIGFDVFAENVDIAAIEEVVNEFRNDLSFGIFELNRKIGFIFFAYTDWSGGKYDVPDNRFIRHLLELPMIAWLNCLNIILKAAEGLHSLEDAKQEIRRTQKEFRKHYGG